MIRETFFSDLCQKELDLCKLQPSETLAVVSNADGPIDYADAFMAAATRLGARSFHIRVPRLADHRTGFAGEGLGRGLTGVTALAGHGAAIAALGEADLIIDNLGMLFSDEQRQLLDGGARILTCTQPVDHLIALFPNVEMREKVERARDRLAQATSLRVTSSLGSDLVYDLGTYPALCQYGYTDTPGRWDHWPSGGFVYTGGADDGVNGRLVLSPGDIIFPLKRYVNEAVELTVEAGTITDIRGGIDASLMRDFIDSYHDPRGYAISHIGWGIDERASWWGLAGDPRAIGMEGRTYAGNVLFSTGPNSELGGKNDTACHQDIPLRGCSLFLDDEPVVIDGVLA